MTSTDPLSLGRGATPRRAADTILLRATRDADLETPIGAFLRLDDGGPAYLLESVEGGERLGRYSSSASARAGSSRSATARRAIQTAPVEVSSSYAPDLPTTTLDGAGPAGGAPRVRPAPPRRAGRGDAPLHRRRRRRPRVRRDLDVRADGPAPGGGPGRRPDWPPSSRPTSSSSSTT